jgi:glycosyltransferase involved in cell wall biosynthesis
MKIVFLSNVFSFNGGVGSYMVRLHKALLAHGHDSIVIHSDTKPAADPAAARSLYFAPEFDLFDWERPVETRTQNIMQLLSKFKPDIVHLQGNNNFHLESEIRKTYASVKALHVYDFCPSGNKYHHATDETCVVPTGPLCLSHMLFKRCTLSKNPRTMMRLYREATAANKNNAQHSKIIVASQFVSKKAMETGYRQDQLEVLPYFTELPDTALDRCDSNRIFFNGRIVSEKGADKLIEAAALLSKNIPWKLIIAGDGPFLKEVKALAKKRALEDRIEFTGWLTPDQIARQYRQAAVVVVPSSWPEPFGIVGIEAMSYAKPVVAFHVGGIPEWLVDGHTGTLVPAFDLEKMAAAIEDLLGHKQKAKEMGQNGRNNVERLFSSQRHISQLLTIYKKVLNKGDRP